MQVTIIDRGHVKHQANDLLSQAQVGAKQMTLFYLGITAILAVCATILPSVDIYSAMMGLSIPTLTPLLITGTFITILVNLMAQVLHAGYILYAMAVRNKETTGFTILFDGFAFASKLISLLITQLVFIWLWSLLFAIPGIIAAYRYRFAILYLCQNPALSANEAMNLSKQRTRGYKSQLLLLDLSYLLWGVLSSLPSILLYGIALGAPVLSTLTLPSILVQTIVTSLWNAAVSCFYLPQYMTAEILYFDIANAKTDDSCENSQKSKEIWE